MNEKFERVMLKFSNEALLKNLTLEYLDEVQTEQRSKINWNVAYKITQDYGLAKELLNLDKIRKALSNARIALKKQKQIAYNPKTELWSLKEEEILTDEWISISSEIEAIAWLHKELHPVNEFEPFCDTLLKHCGAVSSNQTQKRGSGADGGIDGEGKFIINGKSEKFYYEAKRIAPDKQVGEDVCHKFRSVLIDRNIQYGFIITTGTFSKKCNELIQRTKKEQGITIEKIDQKTMIKAMFLKNKQYPYGLGLARTEAGLFINPKTIKKAAA